VERGWPVRDEEKRCSGLVVWISPGPVPGPGHICYLLFMKSDALLARIAVEPGKMGGKPVIRGRRVTPSMVLNMLTNGATRDDVLAAYPVLEPEDIGACLLYAARLSELAAAEGLTVAAK
jgi:uncharacterized protein (DUF433 family)